ncbi:MAG: hypothetical protein Greene071421_123 [Parcubacteria group bacterium Greene0714_21]|nr:MAG: hypothetical protein Greene041639_228 [Parcubacteria group bacterium Greene0416_39]TSC98526.1 MAG: hypothetical protein Greene101447_28 [Parcubacteria group bacterium Greene1014_47]TSD04287.1 MAG: hypothetical protein Greene071421_123 [Parcubacteria group bacterium Greene0714_21]
MPVSTDTRTQSYCYFLRRIYSFGSTSPYGSVSPSETYGLWKLERGVLRAPTCKHVATAAELPTPPSFSAFPAPMHEH